MKKINAKLSISYPSDRTVSITLTDESSRTDFFKGRISYDEFTSALSSLACRPFVHAEVQRLDVTGKVKERQKMEIVCPLRTHDREKLRAWLEQNANHPGWEVDSYLGSQGSVATVNGQTVLRYAIFRYTDPPTGEGQG